MRAVMGEGGWSRCEQWGGGHGGKALPWLLPGPPAQEAPRPNASLGPLSQLCPWVGAGSCVYIQVRGRHLACGLTQAASVPWAPVYGV